MIKCGHEYFNGLHFHDIAERCACAVAHLAANRATAHQLDATGACAEKRTGLASTDALFRIVFALRQLEAVGDFLKERQRLASVPVSLEDLPRRKVVQRVRMKKEDRPCA